MPSGRWSTSQRKGSKWWTIQTWHIRTELTFRFKHTEREGASERVKAAHRDCLIRSWCNAYSQKIGWYGTVTTMRHWRAHTYLHTHTTATTTKTTSIHTYCVRFSCTSTEISIERKKRVQSLRRLLFFFLSLLLLSLKSYICSILKQ